MILNSRPLYAPTDDPLDAPVITPGHLVTRRQLVCPPPINPPPQSNFTVHIVRKEHHKMLESFWQSWSADYLTSLLPRKKWKKEERNVRIGQVVLIRDDNLPPSLWQIGRIIQLIPSKDRLIRSVVIEAASKKPSGEKYTKKTSKFTRAIQKICILPTEIEFDVVMPTEEQIEKAKNDSVSSDTEQ